jgi:hypothetical protein
MIMERPNIAWLAILGLVFWATNSRAQVPYRTYSPPAGPTLPYQLDYFRPQLGALDQYNQFIAPREDLANQMGRIAQRQNIDFSTVQNQLKESDRIRESQAAPTGTAAGFMNFSHYFGGRVSPTTRPARQARPQRQATRALPSIGGGAGIGYGN